VRGHGNYTRLRVIAHPRLMIRLGSKYDETHAEMPNWFHGPELSFVWSYGTVSAQGVMLTACHSEKLLGAPEHALSPTPLHPHAAVDQARCRVDRRPAN